MAFINHLASLIVNVVINTRNFHSQVNQMNKGLGSIVNRAAGFYLLRSAILTVGNSITGITEQTAALEQGFINVERIATNLRNTFFRQQVVKLGLELKGIDIAELQKILKISAQLGIQGKTDMMNFSESVAQFSAITGQSGEQAATNLAKLNDIFNILPSNVDRTINTILQLADDFNATEDEILSITTRIGGVAKAAGLTITETTALATTMKSVEKSTEIAGTSLANFIGKLSTNKIIGFAKALGLDPESTFVKFREAPLETIKELFTLMGTKPPTVINNALKELGMSGARNSAAIIKLVQNIDTLDATLSSSKKGFSENVRLLQQYISNAEGATARINNLNESWHLFLASLGNTLPIKNAMDTLTNLLNLASKIISEDTLKAGPNHVLDPNNIQDVNAKIRILTQSLADLKEEAINMSSGQIAWFKDFVMGEGFSKSQAEELQNLFNNRQGMQQELERWLKIKAQLTGQTVQDIGKTTSKDDAEKEYQEMLKRTKNTSKFKGFMSLDMAWKNRVLDSIEAQKNDTQLMTLDSIYKESIEQGGTLKSIDASLKQTQLQPTQ